MRKKEEPEAKRERIRKYLMECSGQELTEFMLKRHAGAANYRRAMRDAMDKWVEEIADARLAAEVNILREEVKHRSVLPFAKKVQELTPHPEAALKDPSFEKADHRRGYADDAQSLQQGRQFFKR